MKKLFCLYSLCLLLITPSSILANPDKDWMLDGSSYKSEVTQKGENIILSNGLVERIFKNGTTIRLNNLVTGEGLLRSVRQEAEITLNGITLPVGGLNGQPIHNYLLEEWLSNMSPDSMALHCTGHMVKGIKTRFPWKPRKEWISSPVLWPAKGKELVFTYKASDFLINEIIKRTSSCKNRKELVLADFTRLMPKDWDVYTSSSNERNSFENEGKSGEILVTGNSASYAEHLLPDDTEIVIAQINPGTDKSTDWGPGIAWSFNEKTVKVYIRTAESKFGITGLGTEFQIGFNGFRPGEPVCLKMQRMKDHILCSFSYDENEWTTLGTVSIPAHAVSHSVRVGKMDLNAQNTESKELGTHGRCRVDFVKAYGKLIDNQFQANFEFLRKINVNVHYEIYDGIPLMSKWISIDNQSTENIRLNTYTSELLAVMEPDNSAQFNHSFMTPNITVESDFAHCRETYPDNPRENLATERHVEWIPDPFYKTQTHWLMQIPCLLQSKPKYGPSVIIHSKDEFQSHRIWELFHDTREQERKSLQIRKMYRIAAPWIAENPIFMHVRSADNESVKKAIDQCAEVGFEMVIMTFWSGVDIENNSQQNLTRMKELADYAHQKGIALGGYSLLASRSIDKDNDVVMPKGALPQFGHSPCVGSEWGLNYMENIENYFTVTGQDILEHDGSYPGDECASTNHPGHEGLEDSQWKQYQIVKQFYQRCKGKGIFLNIPEWYFMNGQNKTPMGYRESNWSLPRKQQELIERQNIYDGTWYKTPTMGWMMVPLTEYHGGGEAATIEPLKDHLSHYELRLADNFGAGVIACYRGPQLYDSPKTKYVVKKWVDFYKSHRAILDSDIIHLRRPDGFDWDGILHVNPQSKEKGLLMVYNPLSRPIVKEIRIPLYYTGLKEETRVTSSTGKIQHLSLNTNHEVTLQIKIPPYGYNWYIFE